MFQLIIDTKVVLVIRMHTRISSNIGVTSVFQGLAVSNILLQNSRAKFTQYAVCAPAQGVKFEGGKLRLLLAHNNATQCLSHSLLCSFTPFLTAPKSRI